MMIRKVLLRCAAPACRGLRYPHLLAPRACVFVGRRSFADAASPALFLSLFNGAWNSLSKVSQALQQQQLPDFELEMTILKTAIASLDVTALQPETLELLRTRIEELNRVAQKFSEPGMLERVRLAVTLGAEGEKLRAQLTSLAVFVVLTKISSPSASKGLPFLIWNVSLPIDLARTLAESWSQVPRGLRPVCFTTDAEVAQRLEESSAFLHVQVCSEPELQVLQSGCGVDSMTFWMERLQAMLPEPAQKQITGANPTKQCTEPPFREFAHKCMQDVDKMKTSAAQGQCRPSTSTRQVRLVTADKELPEFIATAGCSAFIGSSSSNSLLHIDPSNPCQLPKKVQLQRCGHLWDIASCGRRVVASFVNPNQLYLLDLESMSWKLLARVTKPAHGLSMDSKAVYWACYQDHMVRCVDLQTGQEHVIMGVPGEKGCGEPGERPEGLKLRYPTATALLESTLFVADRGNGRVLSFDMNSREVKIVYGDGKPEALAAHDGFLYIHDSFKHQIFRVCLESLETRPVLGTGSQGFSRDGLPPLATSLYEVIRGGLSITPGGELLVADSKSGVVRAVSLKDELVSGAVAVLPPSKEDWQSGVVNDVELAPEERTAEHRMPYAAAAWQAQHQLSAGAHISPQLEPKPNTTLTATIATPIGDVCIMLVPLRPVTRSLDAYFLHTPDWDDSTCIETLGTIRRECAETSGAEGWMSRMRAAFQWMKSFVTNSSEKGPKKFYLRDVNVFTISVTCNYNEEEDSHTWQIKRLDINGKTRSGSLEELTVGVKVPVAFLMMSADGIRLQTTPVVV